MARFKGKTIEEATKRGLEIIGANRQQVDVYVINAGQAKFFGLYHVSAEVEIVVKDQLELEKSIQVKNKEQENEVAQTTDLEIEEDKELIKRQESNRKRWEDATNQVLKYLDDILEALDIDSEFETTWGQNTLSIQLSTETEGLLIGKYGRTINAMQILATAYLNELGLSHAQVMLNVGNYREERSIKLERLAYRLADKVVSLQQNEVLEPMPAFERKVIHSALSEDPDVLTSSVGKEPFRRVKISLVDTNQNQNLQQVEI